MLKSRGYNAQWSIWTGMTFPNNLQPTYNAEPLTPEELCVQVEAAGANSISLNCSGYNGAWGTDALSFEPRLGQFEDWGGQFQRLVAACKEHGIGLHIRPFWYREWYQGDAWYKHAWNARNGGPLSDPAKVLGDPRAIDAAQRRIEAIAGLAEGAIASWQICIEMPYMLDVEWLGITYAQAERYVDTVMAPWVETMAQTIKAVSDAPVGNGHIHAPRGFEPGTFGEYKNRIHKTPSLDFASVHWYGSSLASKLKWLRQCQQFIGKPVRVAEYAPFSLGGTYTREPPDLGWSKAHEWAAACGEWGFTGPLRWNEYKGEYRTWWGVAHPNMAEIAGVTAQMAEIVDLERWNGTGRAWDDDVQSSGLSVKSAWGDGQYATLYLAWESEGPRAFSVAGLTPQSYTLTTFDVISGEQVQSLEATAVNGQVTFGAVETRQAQVAAYLEPTVGLPPEPPDPPEPETYTLRVRDTVGELVAEVPMIVGEPYELVLEE